MPKVKLTITESRCRCNYCKTGDVFIVEDICPPLCMELWHALYPYLFALRNGADLDCDDDRAKCFTACCPDGGRVKVHGEVAK